MTLANSGKQSGSLHRGPLPHMLQRLTGAMPFPSQQTSGLPWESLACMVSTSCCAEALSAPRFGGSLACVVTSSDAPEANARPVVRARLTCRSSAAQESAVTHQMVSLHPAGVTVPAEHDGLDMGYQAHCIAMEASPKMSACLSLPALGSGTCLQHVLCAHFGTQGRGQTTPGRVRQVQQTADACCRRSAERLAQWA